jgi:putative spermidine/putrescine transport system substrate-binding protein
LSANEELRIISHSGVFGDAFNSHVIEPFVRASGARIDAVRINSKTAYEIISGRTSDVFDVVWMDAGYSELADEAGLFASIPELGADPFAHLAPWALHRNSSGELYAVTVGFVRFGAVRVADAGPPPANWIDFLDSSRLGLIQLPGRANNARAPVFMAINRALGGGPDNLAPGLAAWRSLPRAAFYSDSKSMRLRLESGVPTIGAHYETIAIDLQRNGHSVEFVPSFKDALTWDNRLHVLAASPHKELALEFVRFASSPAIVAGLAGSLAHVPPLAGAVAPGQSGGVRCAEVDWRVVNKVRRVLDASLED